VLVLDGFLSKSFDQLIPIAARRLTILSCERTNQWLDETPYAIDTALVPRGGHRRRKSMEPRALANMNGTLIATPRAVSYGSPSKDKDRDFIPATPATGKSTSTRIGRRESTQWVRTPKSDENYHDDEMDLEFSPLPVTPAPEQISEYAEHVLDGEGIGETPYFLKAEDLIMRTAPPVKVPMTFSGERQADGAGASTFGQNGSSESLMQRLMLARRKSLQWAPKVGSPLARG
jgi:hypothetical protein